MNFRTAIQTSKVLFFLLFLSAGCSKKDSTKTPTILVDTDDDSLFCPKGNSWSHVDIERELSRYYPYSWIKSIYIDDTLGKQRINFDVDYKFTHYAWDGNILTIDIIRVLNFMNNSCRARFPLKGEYYISINYDIKPPEENSALFLVQSNSSELKHYNLPVYQKFVDYILDNMTPSDFQAYDFALKQLYKDTKDEKFNMDFYSLLLRLSEDPLLSSQEEFILESLTNWALSRPKTETREHFDFFRASKQGR